MDNLEIKKRIFIIIGASTLIFLLIIIIQLYNNKKDSRIENKLEKNKYTKITDKIYSKDIETDDGIINYVYNVKNKEVIKTITNDNKDKTMMLSYNNEQIKISYMTRGECNLYQKGLYSKNDYKCDVIEKNGDCKPKCDIMLKEAKKFMKETKNTIN